MSSSLANKIALVTGGSRGIGRCVVGALLDSSVSKVHVLDKCGEDLSGLRRVDKERVVTHEVDLSKWNETKELIESIKDPISCLVNNAGVVELMDVGRVTEANIDLHLDVNVKGVVNVTQCVSENMIRNRVQGSIVNVSSIASKSGMHGHLSYCASKSAVNGITRVSALELGLKGIRVNAVLPTVTMTQMAQVAWSDEEKAATIMSRIPLRRFAETSDVSNAVLFFLSEESRFLNGVFLPVDGGFLID